jgi:hypothetical protein
LNTPQIELSFTVMKTLKSLATLVVLASASAQAAPLENFNGLSFALPNGGGATIGIVKKKEDNKELRLNLSFDLSKAGENIDTTFGFSVEAGLRKYLIEAGKVKMYHQPGFFIAKASAGEFTQALALGVVYDIGGEYWVSPNFSFGARAGLSLTISNEFKAFALKTGTSAISATYYW